MQMLPYILVIYEYQREKRLTSLSYYVSDVSQETAFNVTGF